GPASLLARTAGFPAAPRENVPGSSPQEFPRSSRSTIARPDARRQCTRFPFADYNARASRLCSSPACTTRRWKSLEGSDSGRASASAISAPLTSVRQKHFGENRLRLGPEHAICGRARRHEGSHTVEYAPLRSSCARPQIACSEPFSLEMFLSDRG